MTVVPFRLTMAIACIGLVAGGCSPIRGHNGYIVDAEATPDGPRPAHIKDRIRALGPTVRPDLTLKPADPAAGDWVI